MNKKLGLAVAGAVMAFGATAANAGITIPAGDWTIDIGGNVNAYYSNTSFSGDFEDQAIAVVEDPVTGARSQVLVPRGQGAPLTDNANQVSTGLLPSALGIGGKTRQNDLDIAFQFTFFTGGNSCGGIGSSSGLYGCGGADGNSLNIRQAYMTFGDASWGSIKMGRDLGLFGSDAILSDMTLLGVGVGAGGAGSSTLGRIGSGYLYADWVGQISYQSPNWNGFSFAAAVREPWNNSSNSDLGFEAKASYEWAGDVSGKVWVGGIHQKMRVAEVAAVEGICVQDSSNLIDSTENGLCQDWFSDPVRLSGSPGSPEYSRDAQAWEIGGKVNFSGLTLVGYYYDGENIGLPGVANNTVLTGLALGALDDSDHDVNGGYVQAMYTLPNAGTKIGASWGISTYEKNSTSGSDDFEAESWMIGVYHPLTKSLNLVAEYVDADYENLGLIKGFDGEAKTVSLGAIMFF